LETKRLQELKELCRVQSELLEKERIRVAQQRRNLVPRGKLIAAQCQQLGQQQIQLTKFKEKVQFLRSKLNISLDKVSARRRKLISQLVTIYPIALVDAGNQSHVPTHSGSQPALHPSTNPSHHIHSVSTGAAVGGNKLYTIRGLRLPVTNLVSYEDEEISTALGYAGHLVIMLSKYLQVPLRYRIIYRGSRSDVCDDVVQSATQFPLFFRNADEKRFQCGCILLNKNIEHLLNIRCANWHQIANSHQNTLENLNILLNNEVPR